MSVNPQVYCVQDGARRRYAVPAALAQGNILGAMATDYYLRSNTIQYKAAHLLSQNGILKNQARTLINRNCSQISNRLVTTPPNYMLYRLINSLTSKCPQKYHENLSQYIYKYIKKKGFQGCNVLLGFVRNVYPDLLAEAKAQGLRVTVDQIIAPASVEIEEQRIQNERWPNWENGSNLDTLQAYADYEHRTWDHSDIIFSMSEYVKDGLVKSHIPSSKIKVIEYPIGQAQLSSYRPRSLAHNKPTRVGFLGTVCLRKGIPYFLETARRLPKNEFTFEITGPIRINLDMIPAIPDNVTFTGPIPRTNIDDFFNRIDIFFFPSTCEGSAGSVAEAMARGIPVVTSKNSGSLVRDGEDGYIRNYDDIEGYSDAISILASDDNLYCKISESSYNRASNFTVERYANRLYDEINSILNS